MNGSRRSRLKEVGTPFGERVRVSVRPVFFEYHSWKDEYRDNARYFTNPFIKINPDQLYITAW